MRRDNQWLTFRLNWLWQRHFGDVPQRNPVVVRFGSYAKFRFGSIKLDRKSQITYITITSMFKDQKVPMGVIDHTIAHELCHYTHGFSSLHPRLHQYPHQGGVVQKELENRGLIHLVRAYRGWMGEYRKKLGYGRGK